MVKSTVPDPRRVIPAGASKKEILLAVMGALLAVGLVGFAITTMGNSSVQSGISGRIIAKKFVPRPENQITIGSGGVQRAENAGLYYLNVEADDTKNVYSVRLDQDSYDRVVIGDRYQIPKASLVP